MSNPNNNLIHDTTLYEDIPSPQGRLPREMAVYELLHKLYIPYKRMDHGPMATIEDCHGVDGLLGIRMCKNLFLCNSQKTKFYLLMMPGEKKFLTREVSGQIQSARLSFAPEEYMEEFLHISPGAVSIMGLMNDTEHHVQLLIDEDVLKEEYLGCHPCVNTASLRLKVSDVLEKFLPYVKHEPMIVHLTGGQEQAETSGLTGGQEQAETSGLTGGQEQPETSGQEQPETSRQEKEETSGQEQPEISRQEKEETSGQPEYGKEAGAEQRQREQTQQEQTHQGQIQQADIIIRPMTLEDYDAVKKLWLSIKGFAIRSLDDSREGVAAFLARNPGCSVVAVERGEVVGSILCGHDGRRGCLYHVCVREDHRMRGIGKSMVVHCMNALKEEKISKVSLIAFTRNDIGNAFWKEIGWTRREDLNYYDFTLNEENIVKFNS